MQNREIQLTIDPRSGTTLVEQIYQQLIWLITSGQMEPGQTLPPVRQLANQLAVNLHTIRKAYLKLEEDGFVRTSQGKRAVVISYTSSSLAEMAGAQRSHTVGVILPKLVNPFYHKFLDGVDEIARKAGSMVFVCSSREDPEQAFRYLSQLSAKHVDGIILVSQDLGENLPHVRAEHEQNALPIVTVDCPGADRDCVLLDLENAGYLATHHLVEHGHRRIGLLTFHHEASNVTPVNNGYKKALREAKIEPDPRLVVRVNGFDMGSGEAGMHEFLTRETCPSAFFAISDTLALGAIKALKSRGLHIPEDVALASFNDIDFAELVYPPLTTVAVPVRDMGMKAMEMLQEMIAGSMPGGRTVVLPASLVIRESCGCNRIG